MHEKPGYCKEPRNPSSEVIDLLSIPIYNYIGS